MNNLFNYVLITPARNEEQYIVNTIKSMLKQTQKPLKWVIVNDASTDRTGEIVKKIANEHSWIELVNMDETRDRSFAAKVGCFNAGYDKVKDLQYDVIGNLDADISFDEDYFEFLIRKFIQIKELGVAGTPFREENYSSVDDSFEGESHVAGGCQLFRRQCFEEIGGYIPVKGGGIDWIAVTTARMKGWKTVSFRDKTFFHHRSLGTGESNSIASIFNYGRKDWFLGGHPLWEFFRFAYRLIRKPYIVGGVILIAGYFWAFFSRMERPVSHELMAFHRHEQMQKLKLILINIVKFKNIKKYGQD